MERIQADVGEVSQTAGARMICGDVRELFPEYFKDNLSPFQSVLFQEHCEICEACRSDLIRESQNKSRAGWRISARGFSRNSHRWHRVGSFLFSPARIKLPLEAAALLIVAFVAFHVTHRSSAPVPVPTVNLPAPESQSFIPPPVEPVQTETMPEPKAAQKTAQKTQYEAPARFKPPTASVAAPRVVPEKSEPEIRATIAPRATPETDRAEVKDQIASAPPPAEPPASNVSPSIASEMPAESSDKEKAPSAGTSTNPVVIRELRRPPEDGAYFFLYSPSRKPL